MNQFWTNILDLFTVHQSRMKWAVLGVCGLSVLGAIGGITWYLASGGDAPDPTTADVKTVANYIKSDQFLEKSSVERGEYIEQLMGRYKAMSADERRRAEQTMGGVLRKNRKLEKTFALSFASKQADAYHNLKTPAEKQQFIDRWLTMMEMAHGGRERARKEFQEKGPFAKDRQPPTPEQRNKVIAEYRKNLPLIMSRTSAEDRSKMVNLARDSMQRIRERYGPDSSP
jgi:hypothetical protein